MWSPGTTVAGKQNKKPRRDPPRGGRAGPVIGRRRPSTRPGGTEPGRRCREHPGLGCAGQRHRRRCRSNRRSPATAAVMCIRATMSARTKWPSTLTRSGVMIRIPPSPKCASTCQQRMMIRHIAGGAARRDGAAGDRGGLGRVTEALPSRLENSPRGDQIETPAPGAAGDWTRRGSSCQTKPTRLADHSHGSADGPSTAPGRTARPGSDGRERPAGSVAERFRRGGRRADPGGVRLDVVNRLLDTGRCAGADLGPGGGCRRRHQGRSAVGHRVDMGLAVGPP